MQKSALSGGGASEGTIWGGPRGKGCGCSINRARTAARTAAVGPPGDTADWVSKLLYPGADGCRGRVGEIGDCPTCQLVTRVNRVTVFDTDIVPSSYRYRLTVTAKKNVHGMPPPTRTCIRKPKRKVSSRNISESSLRPAPLLHHSGSKNLLYRNNGFVEHQPTI